jgi:hypothetical protein
LIGVWDTVGSLGVPDDLVLLDQILDDPRNYRFHDTELRPWSAMAGTRWPWTNNGPVSHRRCGPAASARPTAA